MTEKIELTHEEKLAANKVAYQATGEGWRDSVLVGRIVKAINEVRAPKPDPVLTIRQRPTKGGNLHAIRTRRGWIVFNIEDGYHAKYDGPFPSATWDGNKITDWPIVYTPE